MKVERVTVGFGSTLNLGNYNSARYEVQFEARLEEGEDALGAVQALHELAKGEVKRQAEASRPKAKQQPDPRSTWAGGDRREPDWSSEGYPK